MKKLIARSLVTVSIGLMASLAGCASGPSLAELKSSMPALGQDMGRVYFYRTGFIGGAYQPEFTLNGATVGKATPRGVYFKDVLPGSYSVTTSLTKDVVNFTLAGGQSQYVKFSYGFGFNIYPELVEVTLGEREIQDLSLLPAIQK